MDGLERDSRDGRDAARDLLLQWLWTLHFGIEAGGAASARATLTALRSTMDEQPAKNADAVGRERSHAISQHGLAFLEDFSTRVEMALEQFASLHSAARSPAPDQPSRKRHWKRVGNRRR
jgi:hypothetical protein